MRKPLFLLLLLFGNITIVQAPPGFTPSTTKSLIESFGQKYVTPPLYGVNKGD